MSNNLVNIAVSKVQGALFPAKDAETMKVYGKDSAVIMTGTLRAGDTKVEDKYVPLAYGMLNVKAAKATTKDGNGEYLFIRIDGGLQGRLNKAEEGKEYDYIGSIDAGNGDEFTVFGRSKTVEETGVAYIALSSGEKKAKQANADNASDADSGRKLPF